MGAAAVVAVVVAAVVAVVVAAGAACSSFPAESQSVVKINIVLVIQIIDSILICHLSVQ